MTYRQWLKKAKISRTVAVPDICDRLPLSADTPTPAPTRLALVRRVCAGVAAAAVLLCVIGYVGWGWLLGGEPLSLGENPTDSTPGDAPTIPLHVTVQAVTMLHSSTPTPIIDNMSLYVGARLLRALHNPPSEHSECQGVFYDMEQERYFCADHTMKPAMQREGIPTQGLYMHYYHTALGRIVFTCKDSARSSYVYDVASDSFTRLPVSLNHCPSVLSSLQTTHPYVLLHQMGGVRDDLYLVNLLTAELSYILKDSKGNYIYSPMDDAQITEDGKYVHYTLAKGGGDVVNSSARTTVLYEIATGKSRTFTGEIIAYLADAQRFFINTPDGCAVYDIATEKMIPYADADLPAHLAYYTKQTDVYTEYDYRLLLCNRLTGEEKSVTDEYVVASAVYEQYLYYYIRGEERLRVLDIVGGGEEYLPLDKAVVEETEGEENKDRSLRFGLQIDEESKEIWLYYSVTDAPRRDAEQVRQEREKVPYYAWQEFVWSGDFTSITALEPLLRRYPEYTVTAYEGNGFLYVDYTNLSIDEHGVPPDNVMVALEYYDKGMFYDILHNGRSFDTQFTVTDDEISLAADAQQKTKALLQELGIPIHKATFDYRAYLSDDPQVKIQAELDEINGERVRSYNFMYIISEINGYSGTKQYLESEEDLHGLYEFIDFTDSLTYYKLLDYYDEEAQAYYCSRTYLMHCRCWELEEYELYIGRINGEPFLVKNGCLADLTEEQYAKWSAWMDTQEPKVHAE